MIQEKSLFPANPSGCRGSHGSVPMMKARMNTARILLFNGHVKFLISEHAYVGRVVLHDFTHQALCFRDAVHDAVVAAVGAIFSN